MYCMFTVECQMDLKCVTIISHQKEVAILKSVLTRPEFCVDSILKDNNKLTPFYTGMPTYESFMDFLQPKGLKLTPWNDYNMYRHWCKQLYHLKMLPKMTFQASSVNHNKSPA